MLLRTALTVIVMFGMLCGGGHLFADTLEIQSLAHGQIVSGTTVGGQCVTVDITGHPLCTNDPNPPESPNIPEICGDNLAITFDTASVANGVDDDLRGPPWGPGNIFPPRNPNIEPLLGNILTLADPDDLTMVDNNNDDIVDGFPNDSDNGGWLCLNFSQVIDSFGFTAVDFDDAGNACCVRFFRNGNQVGRVAFVDTVTNKDLINRDGFVFGDNSINVISPLNPQDVFDLDTSTGGPTLVDGFDKVCFRNLSSGAFTDINFTCRETEEFDVPTLNQWGLILMAGLLFVAAIGMMRRKTSLR